MLHILMSHWVFHLYVIVMAILGVLWIWFNVHRSHSSDSSSMYFAPTRAGGGRISVLPRRQGFNRLSRPTHPDW